MSAIPAGRTKDGQEEIQERANREAMAIHVGWQTRCAVVAVLS